MLAYTNKAGVLETLATGYAVFYSRSRKCRWKKGEQSGNTLPVTEIRIDCDGDALIYKVSAGFKPVCHTGKRSCFFRLVIGCSLENAGLSLQIEILPAHPNISGF